MSFTPHRVGILVYDGVTLLDVAGPAEVFKEANRFGADYRIVLMSPTGADVTSNLGIRMAVDGAVPSEPPFDFDLARALLDQGHTATQAAALARKLSISPAAYQRRFSTARRAGAE